MLNAACTGSSWNGVPGTLAPFGTTVPGTIGPEQLGAGRVRERLEAAAERVDQAVARGVVGLVAVDLELRRRSRRCRPGPGRASGGRC